MSDGKTEKGKIYGKGTQNVMHLGNVAVKVGITTGRNIVRKSQKRTRELGIGVEGKEGKFCEDSDEEDVEESEDGDDDESQDEKEEDDNLVQNGKLQGAISMRGEKETRLENGKEEGQGRQGGEAHGRGALAMGESSKECHIERNESEDKEGRETMNSGKKK